MADDALGRRHDYDNGALRETDVAADPLLQFSRWLDDARAGSIREPNAMTLATATAEGAPAARIVLLRAIDERGFVFFSNYDSRKGGELAANPQAALLFFWEPLERQVRIEGHVTRVSAAESDAYFASRPRGSQLGAWASPQSAVLADAAALEDALAAVEARFSDRPVTRPPHWGGYRLSPTLLEFWQGRPGRLHDRLRYRRTDEGWLLERLAP